MENKQKITDANTPLHLLQPDFEIAYSIPSESQVTDKLEKVLLYLETVTPATLVDSAGKTVIFDFSEITTDSRIQPGDFRLTSYEWGVTYLKTSATAIFTYCIAWAINQGYLGAKEFGPMVILDWNAVNSKITNNGQVEGTCVGTGMGFDPAFYSYRPISPYAAHGYGPVILASAEIIRFIQNYRIELNENALQILERTI